VGRRTVVPETIRARTATAPRAWRHQGTSERITSRKFGIRQEAAQVRRGKRESGITSKASPRYPPKSLCMPGGITLGAKHFEPSYPRFSVKAPYMLVMWWPQSSRKKMAADFAPFNMK